MGDTPKTKIVAGWRDRRWDISKDPKRESVTFLRGLQTMGYTKIRLDDGTTHTVADRIALHRSILFNDR